MNEYYKKIDKSFFDGKITVPNDYIDCFVNRKEFETTNSRTNNIYKNRNPLRQYF